MTPFSITLDDFTRLGAGLRRPESVLTTRAGDIYCSSSAGGITRIRPDGSQALIGRQNHGEQGFIANGFALLPDETFLIANIGRDGGVWQLDRNGDLRPWLMEAEGRPLGMPNFVLLDHQGRVWVIGLPNRMAETYAPGTNEGFIVLTDGRGSRIVAEGIDFPNELRLDCRRGWLYTNETFLARTLRFRLGPDGTLPDRETVMEYDRTDHLDGFCLDEEGKIWTTSIVVNRIYRVDPDAGTRIKVFEELSPDWAERAAQAVESGKLTRGILHEDHGLTCRNLSSLAFGGDDLRTLHVGQLAGDCILTFRAPVAGDAPAHWSFVS